VGRWVGWVGGDHSKKERAGDFTGPPLKTYLPYQPYLPYFVVGHGTPRCGAPMPLKTNFCNRFPV
jgi:hypothetical protein